MDGWMDIIHLVYFLIHPVRNSWLLPDTEKSKQTAPYTVNTCSLCKKKKSTIHLAPFIKRYWSRHRRPQGQYCFCHLAQQVITCLSSRHQMQHHDRDLIMLRQSVSMVTRHEEAAVPGDRLSFGSRGLTTWRLQYRDSE